MTTGVLFDFYGTVATAAHWPETPDAVLARHGYLLPPEAREAISVEFSAGLDHHEHSITRERYIDWDRRRLTALVEACRVPRGHASRIVEELWKAKRPEAMQAYPEAVSALRALRQHGVRVGLCSNWDWDLEDDVEAVGLAGCFDVVISSAQAGARKPHERIFQHALAKLGLPAEEVLFVGDTLLPDVHGPLRVGMRAAYLRRPAQTGWPGLGTSEPEIDLPLPQGVPCIADLSAVAELLGLPAGVG
jgi:putative hydrolase of the HAD superfamily